MYVNNLVSENPAVNKMIEPEKLLPKRVDDSHKGTYGRALLIAGSKGMAGAACLAGLAAYRAGCGLVEIVTHESNRIIVQTFLPEAVVVTYDEATDIEALIKREADRADSLGIGPGIGLDDTADKLTASVCRYVGEKDIPAVFDADALTILGGSASLLETLAGSDVVVTPHPKEMSVLIGSTTGQVNSKRIGTALSFACRSGINCLLKGHRTIVAFPDGSYYENRTGNSGMATGGSGDVLTGLITSLTAQGMTTSDAAMLGAWLHGAGGDRAAERTGRHSLIARDLIDGMVEVIKELE